MYAPFYSTVFLAFESGNVIGLRMMKMMSGGRGLHDEAHLMVIEKVHAMFEAGAALWLAARRAAQLIGTGNTSPQTRNDYHNPAVSWFRKWNYVGHRTFFLTAITRSKEEET